MQQLHSKTARAPLLLFSSCIIAVRHARNDLATTLTPRLFDHLQALLGKSLLVIAESLEFFQAVLILSLWSTTVGGMPLRIDGWLLTNYAIQQAQTSPVFSDLFTSKAEHLTREQSNVLFVWNHICLAHLQYVCFEYQHRYQDLTLEDTA